MALFERLFESRALSFQTIFRTGLDTFPVRPESGFFVDSDTSMRLAAVWSAQRLITGDVSTLPVEAFVKDDTGTRKPLRPKPAWIEEPDPFDPSFTRVSHFGEVVLSILQDGNSFTLVEPSVLDPQRVEVLRPTLVQPLKPPGQKAPTYRISDARGRVVDELTALNIIHIAPFRKPGQLRGLNPIDAAAEGIGIGLAAERFTSRYFLSGASMPGFIETQADLTDDQIKAMDRELRKSKGGWRNAGVLGYLTGGAHYNPTGIDPQKSDLSAIRQYQVEDIARIYGIPPHMLGILTERGGNMSVEQRSIDYIAHGLRHYIEPIEIGYRRLIPGGTDTYLKFNFAGLLRGDILSRYGAYNIGIRNGFLSVNDVRKLEDYAPVEGGDKYAQQAQMQDITLEGQGPIGVGGNVTGAPLEVGSSNGRSHDDLSAFTAAIRSLGEPPVVNLPAPVVKVAAPVVNVPAPIINVEAQPAPVITVEPTQIDTRAFAEAIERNTKSITDLSMTVMRPRQVLRDSDGKVIGVE